MFALSRFPRKYQSSASGPSIAEIVQENGRIFTRAGRGQVLSLACLQLQKSPLILSWVFGQLVGVRTPRGVHPATKNATLLFGGVQQICANELERVYTQCEYANQLPYESPTFFRVRSAVHSCATRHLLHCFNCAYVGSSPRIQLGIHGTYTYNHV